jgi:Zn-finger nucleic acid-binding protein
MFQLEGAAGVLAGCDACGGIWVDAAMGLAALTGGLSDEAKEFIRGAGVDPKGSPPVGYRDAAHRAQRRCPVCTKPLEQRVHAEPRLLLDVCEHGTYFDVREMDAIVHHVGMQQATADAAAHVAEAEADCRALQRAAGGSGRGNNGYLDYIIYLLRKR